MKGRVALVTGGTSGIGRATAVAFARAGANVVVAGRRESEGHETVRLAREAGAEASFFRADVSREADVRALVDHTVQRFGRLDIAFNNAGVTGALAPLPEISPEGWRDTLEVNLTSAFLGARAQIPAMAARGGGSLIFTSTFVGHTVGFPGMAAYAASKAGLIGLVQVIAAEWGAKGIRANAILPGGTDTAMGQAVADTPDKRRFIEGLHALKRLAAPEEIAEVIAFLASDRSGFMTGATVAVDAGRTAI